MWSVSFRNASEFCLVCFWVARFFQKKTPLTLTVLILPSSNPKCDSHSETSGSLEAIPQAKATEDAATVIQRRFRAAVTGSRSSTINKETATRTTTTLPKDTTTTNPPAQNQPIGDSTTTILGPFDHADAEDDLDFGSIDARVAAAHTTASNNRAPIHHDDYEHEEHMVGLEILMMDDDQEDNIFDALATSPTLQPKHLAHDDDGDDVTRTQDKSKGEHSKTGQNLDDGTQQTKEREEGEDEDSDESKDNLGTFAKIAAIFAGVGAACVALYAFLKKCCKCCKQEDETDMEDSTE